MDAPSIFITVEFSDGNCTTSPELDLCTLDFGLLIYPTQTENLPRSRNVSNYMQIVSSVPNNVQIPYMLPGADYGFYLAFSDISACVVINRVRVVHTTCSGTTNGFALYHEALSGLSVMGACVDGAEPQPNASLEADCVNGMFNFSATACHCMEGHQNNGSSCIGKFTGLSSNSISAAMYACFNHGRFHSIKAKRGIIVELHIGIHPVT